MEIILNLREKNIKLENKKIYALGSFEERKKDKFLKDIYSLNKNKITYVDLNNYDSIFNSNIYLDITNDIRNIEVVKLRGFLELFKLDNSIMNKNFYQLSNSEKKKIILISAFLSDKPLIIINNSTIGLDRESKLELLRIMKHEKRNEKIIIFFTKDSNFIYEVADKIIKIEKNEILDKYDFFSKTRKLNKYNIELPDIEKFIKYAFKIKKIKLSKTNNVNDLVKDVYRSVQ